MNTRSQTIIKAALLLLLCTMQGLCHAHQVDHFIAGDSTPCSVCSASGQLESAAIDTAAAPIPEPAVFTVPAFIAGSPRVFTPASGHARAPPLSR